MCTTPNGTAYNKIAGQRLSGALEVFPVFPPYLRSRNYDVERWRRLNFLGWNQLYRSAARFRDKSETTRVHKCQLFSSIQPPHTRKKCFTSCCLYIVRNVFKEKYYICFLRYADTVYERVN